MGNLEDKHSERQETTQETREPRPELTLHDSELFTAGAHLPAESHVVMAMPPELEVVAQRFAQLERMGEASVDRYLDATVMMSPISYLVNDQGEVVEVLNTATLTHALLEETTESGGKIVDLGSSPAGASGGTLSDLIQDNSPEATLTIKSLLSGMLTAGGYAIREDSIQFYKKERVIIAEVETEDRKLFVKLVEPGTGEQELLGAERAGSELPAVSAEKLVRTSAYEALVQPYIDAIGHDKGVMSDLISHTELETDPAVRERLTACVHDIYTAIHSWSRRTMEYGEGPAHNDIFYHDRLAPDGRINQYYEQAQFQLGNETLTWHELQDMHWTIDGVRYQETLGELLEKARLDLNPHTARLLCSGHGDSTEMNIISNGLDLSRTDTAQIQDHVFGMIDLETVGTNDAFGDGINHLVYLTVKGGFSVPKYYPEVLQDRPGVQRAYEKRVDGLSPESTSVVRDGDTMQLHTVHPLPIGDTRKALAKHFVERHLEPLLDRVEQTEGLEVRQATEARLGSYLLMRFIGVHNVSTWEPADQTKLFATLIKSCATPLDGGNTDTSLQRFLNALA